VVAKQAGISLETNLTMHQDWQFLTINSQEGTSTKARTQDNREKYSIRLWQPKCCHEFILSITIQHNSYVNLEEECIELQQPEENFCPRARAKVI
jgi:hypothetical protein